MILVAAIFLLGMAMSAFFSGSETGFYRMTRLRLVMEALSGDWLARIMLWLTNQPSLFVATALAGNNVANYLTSLSVVMGAHRLFPTAGAAAEIFASMALAPILFVGGELMPKNLFFNAPNRLMRRCSPLIVACVVLFAPVTLLLWIVSLALRMLASETPQEVRLSLARRELNEMLVEGHEAGLLRPVQRKLAQAMLTAGGQPVRNFGVPAGKVVRATTAMNRGEILRIAQRHRRTLLPVEDANSNRKLIGFVRSVDLLLDDPEAPLPIEPFVELSANETFLSALGKLGAAQDALGRVSDAGGRMIGFVSGRELRQSLLAAPLTL